MECLVYTNAQSLLAHKEEIHLLVMKENPAIVALTETRLTKEIDNSEVNMPGYSMVRCDDESRNTGDVTMYVRGDIKYETIMTSKIESNY